MDLDKPVKMSKKSAEKIKDGLNEWICRTNAEIERQRKKGILEDM